MLVTMEEVDNGDHKELIKKSINIFLGHVMLYIIYTFRGGGGKYQVGWEENQAGKKGRREEEGKREGKRKWKRDGKRTG